MMAMRRMMIMMMMTYIIACGPTQVWSYAPLHQQLKRQLTGDRRDDGMADTAPLSAAGFGDDADYDAAADATDDSSSEVASSIIISSSPSKKASSSSHAKAKSKPRLLTGDVHPLDYSIITASSSIITAFIILYHHCIILYHHHHTLYP